jgi:hypothetical protein
MATHGLWVARVFMDSKRDESVAGHIYVPHGRVESYLLLELIKAVVESE